MNEIQPSERREKVTDLDGTRMSSRGGPPAPQAFTSLVFWSLAALLLFVVPWFAGVVWFVVWVVG